MKRKLITAVTVGILGLLLVSCNSTGDAAETDYEVTPFTFEWKDDPTVGKVQPGYYKRVGIVKRGETFEELLEQRDIESKGYLVVNDDGTATLEYDGEKTEYVYDEYKLYLREDTEKVNGIPYVFIGGRIVFDDGETITQYINLTDEELEVYLESRGETSGSEH